MTPSQIKVRDAFIKLQKGDLAPSIREVCIETGMRLAPVHDAIQVLVDNGDLIQTNASHRKYRAIGFFNDAALDRLSHAELLDLQSKVERRLRGVRLTA